MDIDSIFADFDAHSRSEHGRGATEILNLLREITSSDPDVSQEALEGLCDHRVLNQGTVFPETLVAVPYMARLAAASVPRAPELLYLLGAIAETDSEVDIPKGAARAAVVDQLPILVPLLENKDSRVRQFAVWAVAQCRVPDMVFDELLARWRVEHEPAVRADLLFGCVLLDPARTKPMAEEAINTNEADQVRIAALIVGLDAGLLWTEGATDIMLSLLPAEERIGQTPWLAAPITEVAERLQQHGEVDAATELLVAAMRMEGLQNRAACSEARRAAQFLGDKDPKARAHLVAGLIHLLDDPVESRRVTRTINKWRTPAEAIVPALVELAGDVDERVAGHALRILTAFVNRS
ncbi:hypothetical protein [Streptomyces sp. NPDC002671]